jgi:hypothetical protein
MGSFERSDRDRVLRRGKAAAARADLEQLEQSRAAGGCVRARRRSKVRGKLGDAGAFEMFEALPGGAGLWEREMENAYAKALGQPEDLIL